MRDNQGDQKVGNIDQPVEKQAPFDRRVENPKAAGESQDPQSQPEHIARQHGDEKTDCHEPHGAKEDIGWQAEKRHRAGKAEQGDRDQCDRKEPKAAADDKNGQWLWGDAADACSVRRAILSRTVLHGEEKDRSGNASGEYPDGRDRRLDNIAEEQPKQHILDGEREK